MQEQIHTVTQALDAIGFGRTQWLLLCYCGLAWLADACEVMLLSFLGPAIRCSWGVGPGEESLLTSVVFVGMLAGVYSLGVASDHLGRRRGFLASALLLGAAGLASAAAPSFAWLLVLRTIVGFALGGTPIAVTLFAEWCTSKGRGRYLLLMQSFWTLGTLLEALLAWAVLPSLGWRWLLALSALPLLALLALFPLVPESAHWLVAKGRYAEAEAVLLRAAAFNGYRHPLRLCLDPGASGSRQGTMLLPGRDREADSSGSLGVLKSGRGSPSASRRSTSPGKLPHSPEIPLLSSPATLAALTDGGREHRDEPEDGHEQRQQHSRGGGGGQRHASPPGRGLLHSDGRPVLPAAAAAGLRMRMRRLGVTMSAAFAAVFSPHLRRTTLLLYGVWFTNAVTYYGLVLLTTALQTASKKVPCTASGAPNLNSHDYGAILITTLAECPGLLVAALLIDGPGRRRTLQAGLALCAVAMVSLVADPPRAGQLALLFLARGCIEGTYSVLYVYTPELYPTAVRSFGLALCNGFSRFGGLLAPFATVYLVESGHTHAAELLLGGLCAGATVCALLLPIETRGRDLQSAGLLPESAQGGGQQQQQQQQRGRPSGDPVVGSGGSGPSHAFSLDGSPVAGGQRRSSDSLAGGMLGVQVHRSVTGGEAFAEQVPAHHDERLGLAGAEHSRSEDRPLLAS